MPLETATALVGVVIAGAFDACTGYIPDSINFCTALLAFAFAIETGHAMVALYGAFTVAGPLFALYMMTARRGLGLGDVKLGIALGAGLGPREGLEALATAFVLGAAFAILLLAAHRARRVDGLPFAPFMATGALLVTILRVR